MASVLHDVVLARGGAIPRTSSGKIRRAACRAMYLAGSLRLAVAPTASAARRSLVDGADQFTLRFAGIVGRVLRVEPHRLSVDDTLVGRGLDSVTAIALQVSLHDEFGVTAGPRAASR
jgi:acyl carrier protein